MTHAPKSYGPPIDHVPGSVGTRTVILHNEHGAAYVDGIRVWPSGCTFRLGLVWRPQETDQGPLAPMFSRVHAGYEDRFVSVTIETADGRVLRTNPTWTETDDDLIDHNGIGTDRWADATYWVSPLPEPPLIHVTLDWPAANLSGRAEVSTGEFAAAARESFSVW